MNNGETNNEQTTQNNPVQDNEQANLENKSQENENLTAAADNNSTEKAPENGAVEQTDNKDQVSAEQDAKQPDTQQESQEVSSEKEDDAEKGSDDKTDSQEEENTLTQEQLDAVFNELKEIQKNNGSFEVEVKNRIRGGLRVTYKDMPLFLPSSHFALKRTADENSLNDSIGKNVEVQVHEMQELDEGRKAVIVTRKNLLMDNFWNNLEVGQKVKGKVSSIASFGVFVDLGGMEGLIHISRLSQVHVEDPKDYATKGEEIEAVIVELDREKNRIALSRKELEESPWKNVEEEFAPETRHKGIVRRLTDFGAYVELKPGVDGLLRTSEISWTKRIKKPSDIFSVGQELELEVLNVSEEKQTVSLSYRKTQPNPWPEIAEKFPVETEVNGTVEQIMPQGAIVSISEDIDGFMPRSKMKNILKGKKIPFQPGDKVDVVIADLVPDEESLILAPTTEVENSMASESDNRGRRQKPSNFSKQKQPSSSVTLLDMLSETDKKTLFKSVDD